MQLRDVYRNVIIHNSLFPNEILIILCYVIDLKFKIFKNQTTLYLPRRKQNRNRVEINFVTA